MFEQTLKKVVDNVDGGIGAVVMGFDGIKVETYIRDDDRIDIDTIGMEFSFILTQIKKAAEILEVGFVHEVTIKAEQLTLSMRLLNEDYFMAVALRNDGNFGKCRYLMRMAAPQLTAEF